MCSLAGGVRTIRGRCAKRLKPEGGEIQRVDAAVAALVQRAAERTPGRDEQAEQ
jgi:hypothetical protein